jgi:hypothetical protein
MPLRIESLIKIFRATRRVGAGRPVLVVTGDTSTLSAPFSEFYIFHEFTDMPFLYSRTTCSHPDILYLYDFGKYPEIFSAQALLASQLRAARDRLEQEVFMRDRLAAADIFYSGNALTFEETGDLPIIEFAMFRRFLKERDAMFKFSKSQAIQLLKEKLMEYPEAVLQTEPTKG